MNDATRRKGGTKALGREVTDELGSLLDQLGAMGIWAGRIADQVSAASKDRSSALRSFSLLERAKWLQRANDMRERAFGETASMFKDPAFDILLMIYIRTVEGRKTSVTASTSAGNTASTTGLRWFHNLLKRGLVQRISDPTDGRRSLVSISPTGRTAVERYLDLLDF